MTEEFNVLVSSRALSITLKIRPNIRTRIKIIRIGELNSVGSDQVTLYSH